MSRKASIGLAAAMTLALGIQACGGGGEGGSRTSNDADALARVGDQVITAQDVDAAIEALPQHQQAQFDGILGRRRMLEDLMDRRLIVLAAEQRGLDEDPAIVQRLQALREGLLAQAYNNYLLEAIPEPTEDDLRAYYDSHPEEFIVRARVNASWIKCATQADAEAARKRIVDEGEPFPTVAREVSIDECSKGDGGLLGYFNPVGYIRCVGHRQQFTSVAFALEADDVSEVFEYEGGWGIIKVHEKTTERQQPYSKARERIEQILRPRLNQDMLETEMARLRNEFGAESFFVIDDALADKSADDLMRLATEATLPQDKIDYYRALIKMYPQYERADQAQFMIAFELSEQLKNFDAARIEYQKVLDNYPNSSVRESAEWMMENMGTGLPPTLEQTPVGNEGTR